MAAGSFFLLASLTSRSLLRMLVSYIMVFSGVILSVLAFTLRKKPIYIFFSSFFILFGVFFLLLTFEIIPLTFKETWPVLAIFASLSFIPSGWYKYHGVKMNYIVCALGFLLLGVMLLFFSLDVVPFSFKDMVLEWWPLGFVALGFILVLSALGSKKE
jgi:hypothetical protein